MYIHTKCGILPTAKKNKHESLLEACLGYFQTQSFPVVKLDDFTEGSERAFQYKNAWYEEKRWEE